MGSETALWKRFKTIFGPTGHWVRVENSVGAGVPDVNGRVNGTGPDIWLELKYCKAWPKRPTTRVRLRHFTKDQRRWLVKRGAAGGSCGILWQINRDYLLFGWWEAPYLGELTKGELFGRVIWRGNSLKILFKRGIEIKYNKI